MDNKQTFKDNEYVAELKKFIGKECDVWDVNGDKFIGIVKTINFMYLNVILMTNTHKVIIKNISRIERRREKSE